MNMINVLGVNCLCKNVHHAIAIGPRRKVVEAVADRFNFCVMMVFKRGASRMPLHATNRKRLVFFRRTSFGP